MKLYSILFAIAMICIATVGYSDSHVIKKTETFQAQDNQNVDMTSVDLFAELPVELILIAPDLGKRNPERTLVSDKLAEGFFMSVRPPPECKVKYQN